MLNHTQVILHDNDSKVPGDCFRTCLASVLELNSVEQVPHFAALGAMHCITVANLWLADEFGLLLHYRPLPLAVPVHVTNILKDCKAQSEFKEILVSGYTTRHENVRHMCVGVLDDTGPIVTHDPHPSRLGLKEIDAVYFFTKV